MRVTSITSALAACFMLVFPGCLKTNESPDVIDTINVLDTIDAVDAVDATDLPAVHPFLKTVDMSGCQAQVCAATGDPYSEFKEWCTTNGFCVGAPDDLLCRMKSQFQGEDWPDDVEKLIKAASVAAGGFSESQKAALRCLAWMEPSRDFGVYAFREGSGSPENLILGLTLDLPDDKDAVADRFLDRLGPYIGAAFELTPDYNLETKVERLGGGGIGINVTALSYKGIALRDRLSFDMTLEPIINSEPGQEGACPGRYITSPGGGYFDRRVQSARVDEEGRVSLETALQNTLAYCGTACWALQDPTVITYLTKEGLIFEVQVGCPSHCDDEPNWTCTYTVNAYTGDVLSGSEDCCVDCFYFADQ